MDNKMTYEEKLMEQAKEEYAKNGRSEEFIRLELECAQSEEYAYRFALEVDGADISVLQKALIGMCDYSFRSWTDLPGYAVEYVYKFARDVKGADISKLQRAVIGVCDREDCRYHGYDANCPDIGGKYACKFAEDIEGADIKKLQKAVIGLGKSEYIYDFAKNVKGADIAKLQKAIFDCYDDRCFTYISRFANFVDGADVAEMQKMAIESGAGYILLFARDVKASNKEELTDAIIASENATAEDIYEFAYRVEGANIDKLQEAIISKSERGVGRWICKFAKNVDDVNLDKFQDWAIQSQNNFCIREIAKIRGKAGLPIDKLEDAVIKYGDAFSIQEFSMEVKGSNSEKLQKAFEKAKKKEDADTFNV